MNVGLYMKGRNRLKVFEDRVLRERFRVKRGNIHTYIPWIYIFHRDNRMRNKSQIHKYTQCVQHRNTINIL